MCCGKKWQKKNATFNLIYLGLGWPWVGEFVGFIIIFVCFPTQQNLVNRKHPITCRITCRITVGKKTAPAVSPAVLPTLNFGRYMTRDIF